MPDGPGPAAGKEVMAMMINWIIDCILKAAGYPAR